MKEEIKELPKGQYQIPEGMVAVVSKGIVTVRENRTPVITGYRCRDCKHFASGHCTDNYWTTTICLKKPKVTKSMKPGGKFYYGATPTGKICDLFEPKDK